MKKIIIMSSVLLAIVFIVIWIYQGSLFKSDGPDLVEIAQAPIVTFQQQESPEEIMEEYFAAEKWQDRLSVVLDPEGSEPLMAKYYEDVTVGESKIRNIEWIGKKKVESGEYVKLKVSWKTSRGFSKSSVYFLKKTDTGYKLDWQATMGLGEMTWKAYAVQRPRHPVQFRVHASLTNETYFGFRYLEKKGGIYPNTHWEVSLTNEGGSIFPIRKGYVKKNSLVGERLYEILKDGETHRLIVEVSLIEVDSSGSVKVEIISLVSEDWV